MLTSTGSEQKALYSGVSTMVRMGAGDSRNFEVKEGPHRGSVPSPLLFPM